MNPNTQYARGLSDLFRQIDQQYSGIVAHAKGGPRLRVCARKNPKAPPLDLQQHRRRRPKKI